MPKAVIMSGGSPYDWYESFARPFFTHSVTPIFVDILKLEVRVEAGGITFGEFDEDIKSADYILGLGERCEPIHYLIARKFLDSKRVLNGSHIVKYPTFSNKFLQTWILQEYGLGIPASILPGSSIAYKNSDIKLPVVTKGLASNESYSGISVKLLTSKEETLSLLEERPPFQTMLQEFVKPPGQEEFRTIVLGGKSLGTVKRIPQTGFKANETHNVELYPSNHEIEDLLASFTEKNGLDFVAFDYTIVGGDLLIFEVNRFPYIGKSSTFVKLTNVNVPLLVVEYLINTRLRNL